ILMEYGITHAWQVELEWEGYAHRDSHPGSSTQGIGDLRFGSKYAFMNIANSHFDLALVFEMEFPTGSVNKGLSDGFLHFEPSVVMAYDIPKFNHSQIFTQVSLDFVHRLKANDNPNENEPAAHELTVTPGFFIPFNRFIYTTEFTWQS